MDDDGRDDTRVSPSAEYLHHPRLAQDARHLHYRLGVGQQVVPGFCARAGCPPPTGDPSERSVRTEGAGRPRPELLLLGAFRGRGLGAIIRDATASAFPSAVLFTVHSVAGRALRAKLGKWNSIWQGFCRLSRTAHLVRMLFDSTVLKRLTALVR
jgi:hypothetical protein